MESWPWVSRGFGNVTNDLRQKHTILRNPVFSYMKIQFCIDEKGDCVVDYSPVRQKMESAKIAISRKKNLAVKL